MKRYRLINEEGHPLVWVEEGRNRRVLTRDASLRFRNHSPTGFRWGYGGSGPSQLALGIVLDYTGDPKLALQIYVAFKWRFIAEVPESGGVIEGEQIDAFIAEMKKEMEEFA